MAAAVAAGLTALPAVAHAAAGSGGSPPAATIEREPSGKLIGPGPVAARRFGSVSSVTWRNRAEVRNVRNATSRHDVAFTVKTAAAEDVTADNAAIAQAGCTGCRTVAFAFQIGIITASSPTVTARNLSLAVNEQCDTCVTVAVADQFLLVTDEPLRLTQAGRIRLESVARRLRTVARSPLSADALQRQVDALRAEVIEILSTETRRAGRHGVLRLNRMAFGPHGRRTEHRAAPIG